MSYRRRSAIHPWTFAGLVLVGACSSWHTQPVVPAQFVAESHPSKVRLLRSDGSRIVLRHPGVRGDTITGGATGDSVGVPTTDIQRIETLRFDVGKTIALTAFVMATPVILCAATCEFGPGFSSSP